VPCNSGEVIWCRWTPTRSGYYTLTAAGAWLVGRSSKSIRDAVIPIGAEQYYRDRDPVLIALGDPATRQRIQNLLRDPLRATRWDAADIGLTDDLTDYRPLLLSSTVRSDSPYTLDGPACPSRDLRFYCTGGRIGSNSYTESEPIGIVVHEVRVATRSPNT